MDYRIMNPAERKYTFRQSQQISMQTGLIGYLRADFGSTGREFYSTWNDFRKDLKTDDFKKEFDLVINSYRFGDGEFLSGRSAMSKFCYEHPESSYEDDRNHYGVRVDTEQYSYLMRLNPNRGEYNLLYPFPPTKRCVKRRADCLVWRRTSQTGSAGRTPTTTFLLPFLTIWSSRKKK